jgi:hypothetical protein
MYSPLKKADKPVCFTEDILEELSLRTGKDKKLLADIMKHNTSYLKKSIIAEEDLVLINFPNLGKMRFNYYLGLCTFTTKSNSLHYKYLTNKINYLKAILKKPEGNEIKNFNKPLLYISIRKKEEDVERNIVPSFYKYWKILETIHNEEHAKYFKKG